MQKKTVKGKDIFIYDNLYEFNKYHLGSNPKEWRDESVKEGEYIITDEGGITKCLKVGFMRDKKYVLTIMGKYLVSDPNAVMDNTIRAKYCNFVRKSGEIKEKDISEKNKQMGRLMLMGMDRYDAFKKVHPDAKSELYIQQRTSTITSSRSFQNFMEKTFQEILDTSGMTEQWSLENLKKLAEDKAVSGAVREKILTDNLEHHGRVKTVKQIESHTWHASSQIGEGELAEIKKIGEKTTKKEEKVEVQD